MSFLLLSLGPSSASADSSERESVAAGKSFAEMAEKASTDSRALAELYRMQEQYVDRVTGEWRDGPERKKLQEATTLLQRNTEHINSSLTMTRARLQAPPARRVGAAAGAPVAALYRAATRPPSRAARTPSHQDPAARCRHCRRRPGPSRCPTPPYASQRRPADGSRHGGRPRPRHALRRRQARRERCGLGPQP